ncbi:UbiA prenyltransferase family protein, partial [Candidatus Dojkabacteria bacterium]|nr:UbiA prenyltransferase family protein [Candidatus Dojkabacteria bacterium]
MRILKGAIRLSRYKEVLGTVFVLSFFGVLLAQHNTEVLNYQLIPIIILANLGATTFAFMINDVEDAEDDARDPKKAKRNPISAGLLSHFEGTTISMLMFIVSLILFALLGELVFLVGASMLIIGFLYSWRRIRLKGLPFIDMISHGYFLGGAALLVSYLAFAQLSIEILLAFLGVFLVSLGGDMFNEIRDYESDKKAKLKNTVSVLGLKPSIFLRYFFTVVGLGLLGFTILSIFSLLNIPAVIVGIVLTVLLSLYTIFISKESILDYDNIMFYNPLLAIV